MPIQTDREIKANRPDIVIKDKQEKSCLLIDMFIPTEKNSSVKVTEKLSKYKDLEIWLPVKDQLYYRQAIMAFKCISGHAPKYLTSQFITREQVTKRTTRSSQKLNIPLFKTASGQRTFYYRTIGLWNNLDPFLKSSRSVQVFKRILKNKLLDNFVNTS